MDATFRIDTLARGVMAALTCMAFASGAGRADAGGVPGDGAPTFEETVHVVGEPEPRVEGVLVLEAEGEGAASLGPADLVLGRGDVEVLSAHVAAWRPAMHVVIDWACDQPVRIGALLGEVGERLPQAAMRLSLIAPGGRLQPVEFDAGGPARWVTGAALAAWVRLAAPELMTLRPAWDEDDPKNVHEAVEQAALEAAELGEGTTPFVLLLTDAASRHPWQDYTVYRHAGAIKPVFAPKPRLVESASEASRVLLAERVHLLVVGCRPVAAESDRLGTFWWRASGVGRMRLGTMAVASAGTFAGFVGDADTVAVAASRIEERVTARSRPLLVAWRARDGRPPAFITVDCRRPGIRVRPQRVEIASEWGEDPVASR